MHNTSDEITLNNESESSFSCSTVPLSTNFYTGDTICVCRRAEETTGHMLQCEKEVWDSIN